MAQTAFSRNDWQDLVAAFARFFAGRGEVLAGDREISFRDPAVGTELTLRRDGTSRSFMPLHGLEAQWDRVVFDPTTAEIRLEGDGVTYTYRIPPPLQ